MKKVVVAFLFCLAGTVANAQSESGFTQIPKMVQCGPIGAIIKGLIDKDIEELPMWTGRDVNEKSDYVVFVNNKTGTFTIIQFGQEIGCILGIGNKTRTYKLPADGKPL